MDEQAINYRREFLKSPHHAALGLLTLGLGFLSAQVLGLIAGATLYLLGWIYLPDLPLFRRWVDRRHETARRLAEEQKVAEFVQRRDSLLHSLSPADRDRYGRLAQVCADIETARADTPAGSPEPAADPRLRKLDELMWTYLRLVSIEESLRQFLETEGRERVPDLLKEAEAEAARLNAEIESLKAKGNTGLLETRQRYLGSRLERPRGPAQAPAAQRTGPRQPRSGRLRTGAPRPANQTAPRRCHRHQKRRDSHRPD